MLEHQLEQIRSPTLHIVARERWASAAVKTKGKKKGRLHLIILFALMSFIPACMYICSSLSGL